MHSKSTSGDIYERLVVGRGLNGLGLPAIDGRLLVEKIETPRTKILDRSAVGRFNVEQTTGFPTARNIHWQNLHFRNCDLYDLCIFSSDITDCVFENCKLRNLRFWSTQVGDCRFVDCDLRAAAFGGTDHDKVSRNQFISIEFSHCDLRGAAHSSEIYRDCRFLHCRYASTDFFGAIFRNCVFEGSLDDTIFRGQYPLSSKVPPNYMMGCDLRKAEIQGCRFLNIDLDKVLLPNHPDLVILRHGPKDLERWSDLFPDEVNEQRRKFIERSREEMGTPGIFGLSLIREFFSEAEIEVLKGFASE